MMLLPSRTRMYMFEKKGGPGGSFPFPGSYKAEEKLMFHKKQPVRLWKEKHIHTWGDCPRLQQN